MNRVQVIYSLPRPTIARFADIGTAAKVNKEEQIRMIAHAVIHRVLLESKVSSHELAHALELAYPFGQRRGRVYKIWRDEACRALIGHLG